MKRVILCFVFLVLLSGVFAMEDSVKVKTLAGDKVKVYAWPVSGPLLSMLEGEADGDGVFETTFFSLSVAQVKFQVMVIRDGEKVKDVDFLNQGTDVSLVIDCLGVGCSIVFDNVSVEEEVALENDSEEVALEGEVVLGDSNVSRNNDSGWSGFAILKSKDGTLNWKFPISIIALAVFLVAFLILIMSGKKGKVNVELDDDEKELEEVEEQVKKKEAEIKKIKDSKVKREKIEVARAKLKEEEEELRELKEDGSEKKIEEQEEIVENAEDEVEEVSEGA
jgi:F0F1-type ATP synthase membrane subunit b/b'